MCRRVEEEREAERARREGAAYRPKEERERAARESRQLFQASEETNSVDNRRFDPGKNYYEILGVDRAASFAEIRKAYKRLSLFYHPDKHKAGDEEQQAAIAAKFREVAAAFDVLSDEEQRVLYDKIRDYQQTNPGKGLPPLSAEEAARMASGAAELRKLRRMGPKLAKHASMHRQVDISLHKLNAGCTRAVQISRRRVDYAGKEFVSTKTFHLIVRRGSREGDRIFFEAEGEETVDTHPGDLIFTLTAKPHPTFRRKGDKDLELFAGTVPPNTVVHAAEIETLSGNKRIIIVPALRTALAQHGTGGEFHTTLPGQGLFDSKDPWEVPAGDLHVQIRYPPVLLSTRTVSTCLRLGQVYALGSCHAEVPAAMVGGTLAAALNHRRDAEEMSNEDDARRSDSHKTPGAVRVVCLAVGGGGELQEAARAVVRVLVQRVVRIQTYVASVNVSTEGCENDDDCIVEDSTWAALHDANVILLDATLAPLQKQGVAAEGNYLEGLRAHEAYLERAHQRLCQAGILQAVWANHWRGCHVVAAGDACAFLGAWRLPRTANTSAASVSTSVLPTMALPILPWYAMRAGGGAEKGWSSASFAATQHAADKRPTVGVLETSAYSIDSTTGCAELLVAPCREAIVGVASWEQGSDVEEADDDFGYLAAFTAL
jgi:DnaJ-class molecular chaperone